MRSELTFCSSLRNAGGSVDEIRRCLFYTSPRGAFTWALWPALGRTECRAVREQSICDCILSVGDSKHGSGRYRDRDARDDLFRNRERRCSTNAGIFLVCSNNIGCRRVDRHENWLALRRLRVYGISGCAHRRSCSVHGPALLVLYGICVAVFGFENRPKHAPAKVDGVVDLSRRVVADGMGFGTGPGDGER